MYRLGELQLKPSDVLLQQPSPTQQDDKSRLPQVRREYKRSNNEAAALSKNRTRLHKQATTCQGNHGRPGTKYIHKNRQTHQSMASMASMASMPSGLSDTCILAC